MPRKFLIIVLVLGLFGLKTWYDLQKIDQLFYDIDKNISRYQIVDQNNKFLNVTYQNKWNIYNNIQYFEIPDVLKKMIISSEDKRFYQHSGVDWLARMNASLKYFKKKRGASTISEQVVRILYPRPRNLWSRWLEGFEAISLERKINKNQILEFYINQVPFASNRRGFQQAAEYYFGRSLNSLTTKEMLFLIVNLRAPSYYKGENAGRQIYILADKLCRDGIIDNIKLESVKSQKLIFTRQSEIAVNAKHFLAMVNKRSGATNNKIIKTSLDSSLQNYVNQSVKTQLNRANNNINNASVLVINRHTMDVLVYTSISINPEKDSEIDAVQIARQSASTLKPFLYAMALENGLINSTSIIEDEPMRQAIRFGVHDFFNASHKFYGQVTAREALANSLNIPSLKLLNSVGIPEFYFFLKNLKFNSFVYDYNYYNLGLAVGLAETSLLELVRGYAMLANDGIYKEINFFKNENQLSNRRILKENTTRLITSVLSDKLARRIEFSRDSILNFPLKTAVKTGTSTDYKDTWAIGYNGDYVAGVWFGNLNYQSMNNTSGATGPGLILRSVFNELNKFNDPSPLNSLYNENIVVENKAFNKIVKKPRIAYPNNQLEIVINPYLSINNQKIEFIANQTDINDKLLWCVDGNYCVDNVWSPVLGKHSLTLEIKRGNGEIFSDKVEFVCR